MQRQRIRALVASSLVAGALGGAGATYLLGGAAAPAGAQAEFRVTPEQLRINQRISHAAVRRANALREDVTAIQQTLGQVDPLVPGATCDVLNFSGNGTAGIGTIARSCESVVEWTSAPSKVGLRSFLMSDDGVDLHISSSAASGTSVLPQGIYENVEVSGSGDWTVVVRRR